jgi:hypothetical protein
MSFHAGIRTTGRLSRHAGLDVARAGEGPWIVDCVAHAARVEDLDEAVADVITTLAQLNLELNGAVPSATVPGADSASRQVAYAVAEITRMLRDDSPEDAWAVEMAWSGALAGDIDDIEQHVADERAARQRRAS